MFSQLGHSSTKCSVSWDIPAQNVQSAGIIQYRMFSQLGYSSIKCSVSRNFLVQIIQSVGIFQYKMFSQQGYSSTECSVSWDIPAQNVPVSRLKAKDFDYSLGSFDSQRGPWWWGLTSPTAVAPLCGGGERQKGTGDGDGR